jgi:Ca2+-binding RTX toxin-like protein
LEYDLDIAPGADPGRIGLRVGGARSVHVTPNGALAIRLSGGTMRQLAPRAYQTINGRRRAVPAGYVLHDGRVRIHLGSYDHHRPLVIDPALAYSTQLAGNPQAIAVDAQGAAYVTGTAGGFSTKNGIPAPGSQAFVTKLSPDGRSVEYSTYLGASDAAAGTGIAVDAHGAAYVSGAAGAGLPVTNAAQPAFGGGSIDAFVAKLSPDGQSIQYSTYLGGSGGDVANGIAVNAQGDAYVAGTTNSPDFPTHNPEQPTFGGGSADAFAAELSPDGKSLEYSTYVGGGGGEAGSGIALDPHGAAYLTGARGSYPFPTPDKNASPPTGKVFVDKLSPDGRNLDYATSLDAREAVGVTPLPAIAVDAQGEAYVTSVTSSTGLATPGAFQDRGGGGNGDHAFDTAFVAKLGSDGRSLRYFTYLGGGFSYGVDIAVTPQGVAYVTGATARDFPTKDAVQAKPGGEGVDAFVSVLVPDGRSLAFSTYLGGPQADGASGIAIDPQGDAYVTGNAGAGFPVGDTGQPPFTSPSAFAVKLTAPSSTTAPSATCHGQKATIVSTRNHATVNGTIGDDVIVATGRDDRIHGGRGDDIICAGPGDDRIRGGRGTDRIYAGPGNDAVSGGLGADHIYGGRGRDRLYGNRGPDVIHGGRGADRLYGRRGPDRLFGDRGADELHGGSGPDRLHGGPGRDRLYGDRGRDELDGGRGKNTCHAGPGRTTTRRC